MEERGWDDPDNLDRAGVAHQHGNRWCGRVEVEQQKGSQQVLLAMNRRQGLQLRLQATVEGLSVAAITYYLVGLVGYAAKGAKVLGVSLSSELVTAGAIPLIAMSTWYFMRRLHLQVRKMS